MPKTYTNPVYRYTHSPDQDAASAVHHPVVIVGAGPCGLAAALDFAVQGISTVVLDDNNTVSVGSRAICFSKRTLEIVDRYGCSEGMLAKGITWQKGKVFFQQRQLYQFDLLPEKGHKMPAFINLQQYYFEQYMVDRVGEFSAIDLRWQHRVTAVESKAQGNLISVDTVDGHYQLSCDYLLVADGANSSLRTMLGLESKGQVFTDRFLIADIVMDDAIKARFPTERWFWFDPPFHPHQSVLLHRQADDVWRIDFQLGWDADPEEEKKEDNIRPRVQAMLGDDVEFELEWASVYTFQCRMMDSFIYQRVLFVGDAAHQVSPFGARGANGGIQGVENLVWKVARILRAQAPEQLLSTYNTERRQGAAENILNSTRATDFITPKNDISRVFRNATLRLAEKYPFARSLVNSGRLSLPCVYTTSPLNTPDTDDFSAPMGPGTPCADAPITCQQKPGWLLNYLGNHFSCMVKIDMDADQLPALELRLQAIATLHGDLTLVLISSHQDVNLSPPVLASPAITLLADTEGLVSTRYDLQPGNGYLIRPDQHVCARWRAVDAGVVEKALYRALGYQLELNQ